MVMSVSCINVERDAVECLMPKYCQSIKKYAKKYFNLKEKFLIQLLKGKLNYKQTCQQLNLIKQKSPNPNNKLRLKYQNGKFRVLNLEQA